MNYRSVYSKLIRLGKDMTPEGAVARHKARQIKGGRIRDKDYRENEDIDPDTIDMMFRDLETYNYKYIPIQRIEQTMTTCQICDKNNIGFPVLVGGGDSYHKPLICPVCRTLHNSNGTLKLPPEKKGEGDDDPSNPGNYANQKRRMDGSLIGGWQTSSPKPQTKGTPGKPRVVP